MDLKAIGANEGDNKNSVDNEKSAFERFEAELKNIIFGVLFVLLKDDESNIWITSVVSIVQFIQIQIFPFHNQIKGVWDSETLANGIERFLEFFQLVYYFKNTNWSVYIIIFYVGLAVVCFAALDIIYVSYSYSKKKFALIWPLQALRALASLFVTILYLPLLDYFFSVLSCVNDRSGKLVHSIFTEIACWQDMYILHAVLAIVISILFLAISLTISITYFECRSTSGDPNARANARPNFLLNLYQTMMIIAFTFMNGDRYQDIILTMILAGSLVLFYKFHYDSPYYNENIAALWSTLASLNLWTACMLIFSRIFHTSTTEGAVIGWLIGLPFLVVIVLTNRDHRVDLLLINVNKFTNGDQIQNQIRYILKLISWHNSDRNAAILLDGYIEIHRQTCNQDDCPLKQKVLKSNRMTKSLMSSDENLNEKYALLVQLLYKMFFHGIKKFPNDTSLRVSYAFFLLEKMRSKQQALQELNQAEQSKPPFDEQFIIYRYKKIIEDEIAETQNEGAGGLDVISELAFQNHLRQCQANIEKSALQHMEFWSQLSEDNPDLAKLNDLGSKINASVAHVEEHWNKLLKINPNMPKAMRLYGKFLIEIINDREAGEDLLERARMMMNTAAHKKTISLVNPTGNDEFSNDATPTVFISGDTEKFALITGVNLAAAAMFGYNKTELINRRVNMLMSQVYSKYHDSFIEDYLNNTDTKLANTNKEKFVFGKNKSNYIFPTYINIKAVPSILQGIQFISTFRMDKNLKNAAFVVTTPDGTIDAISSSCITMLKLDQKMVLQKKSNIEDFVPRVLKDRNTLFNQNLSAAKSFITVDFLYPKDSEYLSTPYETSGQLNCYLQDMVFLSGRVTAGMFFRFEKPPEKPISHIGPDKKIKIINFQFRYERDKPIIHGEYVEGSSSDINSAGQIDNTGFADDLINSALGSNLGDGDANGSAFGGVAGSARSRDPNFRQPDPEVKKIDYGAGIKILRLVNGRPSEIDERKGSEEDEEEENADNVSEVSKRTPNANELRKNEEDNGDDVSQKEFNTTFKSRKALNQVISDKRPPPSIRNLKWVANTLVLILVALAAIDYFITVREFNEIKQNLDVITKSNDRIAELQNIVSKSRDLYLLTLGISTDATEEDLREEIGTSATNVKTIVDALGLSSIPVSDAHRNLLTNNSVTMKLLISGDQTSTTMYNLDQATMQIISRALNLMNTPLASITSSNTDLFFVTYNNFNEFYEGLRNSSDMYVSELVDRTETKLEVFMVLLLVAAAALITALVILVPVFIRVNKSREEILSLFLDIPERTVKGLYTKCETFISNLQVGEDDDLVSEFDDSFERHRDEGDSELHPRKKRKKFKNSGKNQREYFVKILVAACCAQAFFIVGYFLSKNLLDQVNSISKEFNSTSMAESYFSFVNNVQRQMMIDNTLPILLQDAETVSVGAIQKMYSLDSLIHEEHSANIAFHSENYINYFNHIMMLNPCDLLEDVSTETCKSFASGAVYQGMAVDITRQFENLRYMLQLYLDFKETPTLAFPDPDVAYVEVYTPQTDPTNQQKNNWLNIMKTARAIEADDTQHIFIQKAFRILMKQFQAGIEDNFDRYIVQRIIILILFYVMAAAAYLLLWMPIVSRLSKEIWRTKCMLTMIPLNVVAKIRSVKLFLKKFWNERAVANY